MPRVGRWLELQKIFPNELKVGLRSHISPEFDQKFNDYLVRIHKCITYLSSYIDMCVELAVVRARAQGIRLYVESKCCGVPRCGTCLGKHNFHYPYFRYVEGKVRKHISTRNVRQFFARLGFTEKEIRMFEGAVKSRHMLLALFHNNIRILNYMGITTLSLEEKETPKPKEEEVVET